MVRRVLRTPQQIPRHRLRRSLPRSPRRLRHQPLRRRKHQRPHLRLPALAMVPIRLGKIFNQVPIAHVPVRLAATMKGSVVLAAQSAISSRTTIPTTPRLSPLLPQIRASILRVVVPGQKICHKSPPAKPPLPMAYISSALTSLREPIKIPVPPAAIMPG